MNLKFGHNLRFTMTLENMKFHDGYHRFVTETEPKLEPIWAVCESVTITKNVTKNSSKIVTD